MQPEAGMMVTPNVRLTRPLNEGGMGAVWVADHLALRTQVVVKFITGDLVKNPDALARFEREAAAASQVKSPHVVQTFDHGFTGDGIPYIVMELLEGDELGDYLEKHGTMAPAQVVSLVSQLGRALDKAHAKGIVHRDIKPNNIFLTEGEGGEFFVKLLDFGIAKGVDMPRIDSATRTGAVMGSPFYMSPEQIVGAKEIGPRSDLWAVGVVAFEALTGSRPFEAETMGALAIQIHGGVLPKPSSKLTSLPEAVDTWFERACAREPAARFGTARELSDALGRALAVASTMPPTSSTGPRKVPLSSNEMLAKTTEAPPPSFGPGMPSTSAAATSASSENESSTHGMASTTSVSPQKSKTGAYVGLGVAAVVAVAIAFFAFGRGGTSTTTTPPAPTTAPSGTTAPAPSTAAHPTTTAPESSAVGLVPLPTSHPSVAPASSGHGPKNVAGTTGTGKSHTTPTPSASTAPVTPHPSATSNDPIY